MILQNRMVNMQFCHQKGGHKIDTLHCKTINLIGQGHWLIPVNKTDGKCEVVNVSLENLSKTLSRDFNTSHKENLLREYTLTQFQAFSLFKIRTQSE